MYKSKTLGRVRKFSCALAAVSAATLWATSVVARPVEVGPSQVVVSSVPTSMSQDGIGSCSRLVADLPASGRYKSAVSCAQAANSATPRRLPVGHTVSRGKPGAVDRIATAAPGRMAHRARDAKPTPAAFGSIALPFGNLPALARIEPAYAEIEHGALFDCAKAGCTAPEMVLAQTIAQAREQSFTRILGSVNAAVNRNIAYRRDVDSHGVRDRWSPPSETLVSAAGDCEDFAILKMAVLQAAGVPMKSMSVIVLQDVRRNLFHAVLSIRTNQGHFILDNMQDAVLRDGDIASYLPLYSLSAGRGYIHGQKTGRSHRIASSTALSEIAPGEGPGAFSEEFSAAAVQNDPTMRAVIFPVE